MNIERQDVNVTHHLHTLEVFQSLLRYCQSAFDQTLLLVCKSLPLKHCTDWYELKHVRVSADKEGNATCGDFSIDEDNIGKLLVVFGTSPFLLLPFLENLVQLWGGSLIVDDLSVLAGNVKWIHDEIRNIYLLTSISGLRWLGLISWKDLKEEDQLKRKLIIYESQHTSMER